MLIDLFGNSRCFFNSLLFLVGSIWGSRFRSVPFSFPSRRWSTDRGQINSWKTKYWVEDIAEVADRTDVKGKIIIRICLGLVSFLSL
jgi:hypothetical protein